MEANNNSVNHLSAQVSVFDNLRIPIPNFSARLDEVLDCIRLGHRSMLMEDFVVKRQLIEARKYVSEKGEKSSRYSKLKNKLPGFTISGIFNHRSDKSNKIYTQLLILDIDEIKKNKLDLLSIKKKAAQEPTTLSCFISPSGDGLKIVIPIDSTAILALE